MGPITPSIVASLCIWSGYIYLHATLELTQVHAQDVFHSQTLEEELEKDSWLNQVFLPPFEKKKVKSIHFCTQHKLTQSTHTFMCPTVS
mmetsp:Transcript_35849/g.74573  ORF Transcript_35849/g.74573 Transcript_35849/m.74573 type:complete len:89 (-) Transcript_35849:116-382(-)